MTIETNNRPVLSETQQRALAEERSRNQTAFEVYRFYAGRNDRSLFNQAYIGHWATKSDFGDYLLEQYDAERHLKKLPTWLHPYVALDPVKFVTSFEEAGQYYVAEVEDHVYVFDPHVREQT